MKSVAFIGCVLIGLSSVASGVTISGNSLTNQTEAILSEGQTGYFLIDTGTVDNFSSLSTLAPDLDLTVGSAISGFTIAPLGGSNPRVIGPPGIGVLDLDGSASFDLTEFSLSGGEKFGYVVFGPTTPSPYTITSSGDNYGVWVDDTWSIPANNSATLTFGSQLNQLSEAASINGSVIPEPSAYATILGLLGLGYAVFCRRRRSSSTD